MDSLLNWFTPLAGLALVLYIGMLLVGYVSDRLRPPTPNPLTDDVIRAAAQKGNRVTAIRWYRELHAADLPTAIKAVESFLAETPKG